MRGTLWTSADAAAATGGRGRRDWRAQKVSIDSRTLTPGALFVALQDARDGHAFVSDALRKGAAAAIVARWPDDVGDDAPLLFVNDTFAALQALGRHGRSRSSAKIIGVTGSVGKTGVKEALRHVLRRFGPTHASEASHNNHLGVPLTLANLPAEASWGVLEMGMSHAGELSQLSKLSEPDVAIVTAIAPAHLEHFSTLEDIARAKAEIFEGLNGDRIAIINASTSCAELLAREAAARGARIIRYGERDVRPKPDIAIEDIGASSEGSTASIEAFGRRLSIRLALSGRHWVHNSLAVIGAVEALGLDIDAGASALSDFEAPERRGRTITIDLPHRAPDRGGWIRIIDDSYNANPASMEAAIAVLGAAPGRRIAVLGDMLELGTSAPELHADLARALHEAEVARVYTCGSEMRHLHEALLKPARAAHTARAKELLEPLMDELRDGDVVLVKGSRAIGMHEVIDGIVACSKKPVGLTG